MPTWAHDLSYEEADAWRVALGMDWPELLRKADVKSHKDLIKSRWLDGGAPRDRVKIRQYLEETERKKPTPIGAAIMGLEEWLKVGEVLAGEPAVFLDELARLRQISQAVGAKVEAMRAAAKADQAMAALRSPTPKPNKSRK